MLQNTFKITALAAAMVLSVPAHAAITVWDGNGATDSVTYDQFGPVFTDVSSGTAFTSVGGKTGTLTTTTGSGLFRVNEGNGWDGDFAPGARLLWNSGSGAITFTFANSVSAIGAQIQPNFYGPFVASLRLSNGSVFSFNGQSGFAGNNSAIFIGAKSDSANISSVTFKATDSTLQKTNFAIGELSLTSAVSAVPEPGAWVLMIVGFGLVGASMRRRRLTTTVCYAA